VERLHQVGLRNSYRLKGLRNQTKTNMANSKFEESINDASVKQKTMEVNAATKRRFKKQEERNQKPKAKIERKRKRDTAREQSQSDFDCDAAPMEKGIDMVFDYFKKGKQS